MMFARQMILRRVSMMSTRSFSSSMGMVNIESFLLPNTNTQSTTAVETAGRFSTKANVGAMSALGQYISLSDPDDDR